MQSILIVEDYESIKNIYTKAFTEAGFAVDTAHSGMEGLEKTTKKEYDVILLDILMLELSGIDFLKAFEAKKHPKTIIIVTTNLDSPGVVKKAEDLGAIKYIIKSQYTPNQLIEAVKSLMPSSTS